MQFDCIKTNRIVTIKYVFRKESIEYFPIIQRGSLLIEKNVERRNNINIDIIRILAAYMVLTIHIGQYAGFKFEVGAKGVQLFFILSGYLAFLSLSINPDAKTYYKKRILRIIPSYWFCLLVIYILDLMIALIKGITKEILFQIVGGFMRYAFFIQCVTPTNNWSLWNNRSALWTMSSFCFFYILAPILYKIMKNYKTGVVVLLISLIGTPYVSKAIEKICESYPEEAHIEWFSCMNPITELYCFLLGAVLFLAIKDKKHAVYLLIIAIAMIVSSLQWYAYEFLFTIVIAIAVLEKPMIEKLRAVNLINKLSAGSFMLYLMHPIILRWGKYIGKVGIENVFLYTTALYILCVGGSYLLYYKLVKKIEENIYEKFD